MAIEENSDAPRLAQCKHEISLYGDGGGNPRKFGDGDELDSVG